MTVMIVQRFAQKNLDAFPILICMILKNKKVIFCNNGKLEYTDIQGYVVDSNHVIGSNHPYIINCENGKCKSDRPKSS